MPETLELSLILAMFIVVALLSVLARRLGATSPVVMLVAGVAVAFLPHMPAITLAPDLVLLAFLPPLIYTSGVGMSWRGFRSNLRPILLLAVGCVLFSAAAVAAVTHYALGLGWAVGFALGAIVSPPDAVAAMAVLRRMRLPRRLLTILEGESLVNDATALVTLSFAVEAVATGAFSPSAAAMRFVMIVVGELGFGVAVGFAMLRLRNFAADPRAEVLLALATPFLAFWPPHELGGSGVVACVATGLYVSWNGRNFIRPATRLQGYFIWDLVNWCIEALAFLVTGLQTRVIVTHLSGDGWPTFLAAGALVSVTVIVIRFLWVFPVTYLPRWLWPPLRKREPAPNWRPPFLVGYTGLRGAVSLAAALSIPLMIDGRPFPHRDLILFATICVIVATLVVQGALLPAVVEWLGLGHVGAREAAANKRAENIARVKGIEAVLARLDRAEAAAATRRPAVDALRRLHEERRANLLATAEEEATMEAHIADLNALQLELIEAERAEISAAYDTKKITDEARRRIERELDLEEASIRHGVAEEIA
jgi:CPA1 family monovalent cation:H+ antiporter